MNCHVLQVGIVLNYDWFVTHAEHLYFLLPYHPLSLSLPLSLPFPLSPLPSLTLYLVAIVSKLSLSHLACLISSLVFSYLYFHSKPVLQRRRSASSCASD